MKQIFLLLAVLYSVKSMSQEISYIEHTTSWYIIYDQDGKRVRSFSTSQGELVAYTSTFYIIRQGNSWYYTYDVKGNRIHTFSIASTGIILSASGDTFTTKFGNSWIYTWTKDGKRISTRSTAAR